MSTLVISDLHIGRGSGADVLTRRAARDVLVERLGTVERLVLLGDVLELRHGPARDALARAEPVMRAIGGALGTGGEVVVVPGNHDHAIAAGWLDWRGSAREPEPLAPEQRVGAGDASWIARRLGELLAPARVEVAYPGLWLRDDVYATHGHYLDVHFPIPTFERLAVGVMGRIVGAVPDPATPDDYESVMAPIYALSFASAQRRALRRGPIGNRSAIGAYREIAARGKLRRHAFGLALRLGVLAANRAGVGPVQPQVATHDVRRAGLAAMREAARRLQLAPAHLVFGHTHRTGRLPLDDGAEWRTPAGTQLHNAGNWVFEAHLIGRGSRGASPYWPGGAIALDGDEPPRLERLLGDVPAEQLMARVPA